MFNLFKRTKLNVAEALTNQTIGGQSVMYRIFREHFGCEDSAIRKLELTYFAAAVMTYVYMRFGKQEHRDTINDEFLAKILMSSIRSSGEGIPFGTAVKEYQARFAEYRGLLDLTFNLKNSSTGDPATTLLLHGFECVTQMDARGHMIQILTASRLIQQLVLDDIDFVKTKL